MSRWRSDPRTGHILAVLVALTALQLVGGCVYFNTFYLARRYYRDAEALRLEAEAKDQRIPAQAQQLYARSLEFASKVLADHPDSKWVPEALLISQKALFQQGDLAASIRKGRELLDNFPRDPLITDSRIWIARAHSALGDHLAAVAEARAVAEVAGPELRAEALFVEARALGLAGRREEAEAALDRILSDPDIPPALGLRARLAIIEILVEQGEHQQAADRLEALLEEPGLSRSRRTEVTVDLIDQLLLAGRIETVETRLTDLEALEGSGLYKGVIRYYRGRLAKARGSGRQASENMVLSLSEGVTADWEYRIRLDLAAHLESLNSWVAAVPEYRVLTVAVVEPPVKVRANDRMAAILRLYALRSAMAAVEEGITYPDPRGAAAPSRVAARVGAEELERRRPPPDDPDLADVRRRVAVEEGDQSLQPSAGDVPPGMYLYLLAEHFAGAMALPDSARRYLDLLVRRHPDSELVPQAWFARHEWARPGPAGEEERLQARRRLTEEYPQSRWTWLLLRQAGEDPPAPPEVRAEEAFRRAEALVDPLAEPSNWGAAVDSLRAVSARWPGSPAARSAELAAARLLELGAGPPDSARVAYERLAEGVPETAEGRRAADRLRAVPTGSPPEPMAIRRQFIEQEISSWDTWFKTLQAAQVVRLQQGQVGSRAAAVPGQTGAGGGRPGEARPPGRPPPTTIPPAP